MKAMIMDASAWQLWCFAVALTIFHSSEFLLAVVYHRSAGVKSLLLTGPYILALIGGLAEYALEIWLVPELKSQAILIFLGLSMMILGEFIRKLAIITAQSNFTHDIKVYHAEGHHLVTHGIYRYVRHPSYLGFFIFAVGTQVLLCNPIGTVVYTIVLWRFFADRIDYEEYFLLEFFGEEYENYASRVSSGMPFVT